MNPYGIYQTPQQRLAQLEAQYPQYSAPVQNTAKQPIISSLVMDRQEAVAVQVPMDGTLGVFINPVKNEVYTKKLGNNGLPEFKTYREIQEAPGGAMPQVAPTVNNDVENIKQEIEVIKHDIKELKANAKQSDADDSNAKPVKK